MLCRNKKGGGEIRLKISIIWWEDIYHQIFTSINFCGLYYHSEGNIEKEMEIYEILTDVLYFNIIGEEEFDTEETFKPHNILHLQEIDGMYFRNSGISESLSYITIN